MRSTATTAEHRLVRRSNPHLGSKRSSRLVRMLLFALPLVLLAALLLVFGPERLAAAFPRVVEKILTDPFEVIAVSLGFAAALFMHYSQKGEVLLFTDAALEYRFGMPAALGFLARGWRLPWDQIRSAEINMGLGAPMLVIKGRLHTQRLLVFNWMDPADPGALPNPFVMLRGDAMLRAIEAAPLIAALRARGVEIRYPDKTKPANFDLFGNRASMTAVVVLFVLAGYGVIDFAVIEETYAQAYPLPTFALIGTAFGTLAYLALRQAALPALHQAVLAIMLGAAAGFASAPGLLRINQLTDVAGAIPREYVLAGYTYLKPREPGLPELRFEGNDEYWRQFAVGTTRTVELRRGALGFYQVNLTPIYDDMRAFYRGKRRAPEQTSPRTT